jgi:hypothetical protein
VPKAFAFEERAATRPKTIMRVRAQWCLTASPACC